MFTVLFCNQYILIVVILRYEEGGVELIQFFNIGIWLFMFLVPFLFVFIIYALFKNRKRKHIQSAIFVLIILLIALGSFYRQTHITIDDSKQFYVEIGNNGVYTEILDPAALKEFQQLVEKQTFVRSTLKTVEGVPPYPANQGMNIRVWGAETHFNYLIFIRIHETGHSYLELDSQYYNIKDNEQFVQSIVAFVDRVSQNK